MDAAELNCPIISNSCPTHNTQKKANSDTTRTVVPPSAKRKEKL